MRWSRPGYIINRAVWMDWRRGGSFLDCLPDGYRIRNDGEIAADDPSLPPVPYLGDLQ